MEDLEILASFEVWVEDFELDPATAFGQPDRRKVADSLTRLGQIGLDQVVEEFAVDSRASGRGGGSDHQHQANDQRSQEVVHLFKGQALWDGEVEGVYFQQLRLGNWKNSYSLTKTA